MGPLSKLSRESKGCSVKSSARGRCRLIQKENGIADANFSARGDRGEETDIRLVVLPGGPQHRRIVPQAPLRMGRHRAPNRWNHPGYAHTGADLQHTVEPAVFDKAIGVVAGIDIDIRAKAARVEVGLWPQPAQMSQRSARDQMDYVFVEKIPSRRKRIAPHDSFEFLRVGPLGADPFKTHR